MKYIVIIKTSATQYLNNSYANALMGQKFIDENDVFKFLKHNFKRSFTKDEILFFSLKNFAYFCNGNVEFDMRYAYVSYINIEKKKIINIIKTEIFKNLN